MSPAAEPLPTPPCSQDNRPPPTDSPEGQPPAKKQKGRTRDTIDHGDPFYIHGKTIVRDVSLNMDIYYVLCEGAELTMHLPGTLDGEQLETFCCYEGLCNSHSEFRKIPEQDPSSMLWQRRILHLHEGARQGCYDDTKMVKQAVPRLLRRPDLGYWFDPTTPGKEPSDLDPFNKELCGFKHPVCGRLLCDPDLHYETHRKALESGQTFFPNAIGDANDDIGLTDFYHLPTTWPRVLYANGKYDINICDAYFLRGPMLILTYKLIWFGDEDAEFAPKSSKAYKMRTRTVPPGAIAYTATLLVCALHGLRRFDDRTLFFESYRFFDSIIAYFTNPELQDDVKDLLAWWNQQIFPVSIEVDTGNQGVPAMVARRRARLAAEAEQCRVTAEEAAAGEV